MGSPRHVLSALVPAAIAAALACGAPARSPDLVILGGEVYDGTGRDAVRADVAVRGDRIVAVGRLDAGHAARVIDATGLVVAPGFVDAEGLSSAAVLEDGSLDDRVRQGVTTEVLAGDDSAALWTGDAEQVAALRPFALSVDWTGLAGYRDRLEARGIAHNVVPLVSATRLRRDIAGDDPRPLTVAEIQRMVTRLDDAMRAGAAGVSVTPQEPPGSYAPREELTALARTVARHGGVYATRLRTETFGLREAAMDVLEIGAATTARVLLYDVKIGARETWGNSTEMFPLFYRESVHHPGVGVTIVPETTRTRPVIELIPAALRASVLDPSTRLDDPHLLASLRTALSASDWDNWTLAAGWDGLEVAALPPGMDAAAVGRALPALAVERHVEPVLALAALARESRGRAVVRARLMTAADMGQAIRLQANVGSASAASRAPGGSDAGAGVFASFLGPLVRDAHLLSMPQAISRISNSAAQQFGVTGRGVIQAGAFADLVLFDPATIGVPGAPRSSPPSTSAIRYVLVNGVTAVTPRGYTGARAGRVLLRQ